VKYIKGGRLSNVLAPRDVLIPGNCKYIDLFSSRNFIDMVKDLEMGRISWIIWATGL
jgi:hypothetical protein